MAAEAAARPRHERTVNAAKWRRQLIEVAIDSVVEHGLSRRDLVAQRTGCAANAG